VARALGGSWCRETLRSLIFVAEFHVDPCGFLVVIFVGLVVRFSLTYSYSCGCILVIAVMLVVRFVIVDLCDCDLCE
jgi:hypothetical protein